MARLLAEFLEMARCVLNSARTTRGIVISQVMRRAPEGATVSHITRLRNID
jgi:hypothetical protein